MTSYQCGMIDSFQCSFESNDCKQTLGHIGGSWTGEGPSTFQWDNVEAVSSRSTTKRDHTTQSQFGHLLEAYGGMSNELVHLCNLLTVHISGIEGDNCHIGGQPIIPLNSDTFPDDHCLKFWYRFENSSSTKLEVTLHNGTWKGDVLWTHSNELPSNMWHQGKVYFEIDKHDKNSKQFLITATNLGKYRNLTNFLLYTTPYINFVVLLN